ncbi:hypothetical protein PanWU01x14_067610 [Parasponia andersonii]|uniref:Disease resistance N-terminal domain-containing protein n=1 Tax=Parasponia andersonii TaxID=3476 RepID=A0A2P5DGE8_PARAD|nr:hypothetical protein PanWU01x14_067610 [Parasponia andersonii]
MAEGILFSVAKKLLWRLAAAAVQEIGSVWGVKAELKELENTLLTIKAVLLDAEEKQVHNHQVRNWLEKLEDAVVMLITCWTSSQPKL